MSVEPTEEKVDGDGLIARIKEVLDEIDVDALVQIANEVLDSHVTPIEPPEGESEWMYHIRPRQSWAQN